MSSDAPHVDTIVPSSSVDSDFTDPHDVSIAPNPTVDSDALDTPCLMPTNPFPTVDEVPPPLFN